MHKRTLYFSYNLNDYFFMIEDGFVNMSLSPVYITGKYCVISCFNNDVLSIILTSKSIRKRFLNVRQK